MNNDVTIICMYNIILEVGSNDYTIVKLEAFVRFNCAAKKYENLAIFQFNSCITILLFLSSATTPAHFRKLFL